MTSTSQASPPLDGDSRGPSDDGRRPRVLLGHGGPVIAGAAQRILAAHGFDVEVARDARTVEAALARARDSADQDTSWDALVIDVALPGAPGFEFTSVAREVGVKVVILVASVFRRTSYKRRPRRLYGADDYVEIHHLGDHLPNRLRTHLGMGDSELPAETLREVLGTLNERGDDHLLDQTPRSLAMLIVADVLLYNGDRISEADSVDEALAAVAADLDGARDLFGQVRPEVSEGDLIGDAFRELVASLDRTGDVS